MNKKILLVIAALIVPTAPAYASGWEYDIHGSAQGLYGYTAPASRYNDTNSRNHGTGDADVSAYAKFLFDNDWEAGLYLDLMIGTGHELEDYNQGKWGEEAYGIIDSPYGRMMLGQTFNVAAQFHQGAPDVGPLGIENSDIVDFIANPNWKRKGRNAEFATLNTTYINTDGVAPKVSYISPEFYGTRLGLTYVPDSYNRRGLISKDAAYNNKDGYIASLYNNLELSGFDITSSVAYAEFLDDDKEFSASLNIARGGWTLGGGWRKTYTDGEDKSHNPNLPVFYDGYREGYAWDVGLSYEIGPYQASLSYFKSKADNSDSQNEIVMLSNKYQVNKYIDAYLSAAHVNFEGATRAVEDNNRGYAFVTGLKVSF